MGISNTKRIQIVFEIVPLSTRLAGRMAGDATRVRAVADSYTRLLRSSSLASFLRVEPVSSVAFGSS
jgi:hypothetical protein